MPCLRIPRGVVCLSNATEHTIKVRGVPVRFEFDKRFGPTVLARDGQVSKRQPTNERDPFWRAFEKWHARNGGPPVGRRGNDGR